MALLLGACANPRGNPPRETGHRCLDCNVVLISVDTLRADHLALYGYSRPTTPYLDRLAEDGVIFDAAYNNGGGTLPVHMSMMTSLHPLVHNVEPNNQRTLEADRVTLAEQLRDAGYSTAAFTDGGWVLGRFGFSQGFDVFDDAGGRWRKIQPKALDWLSENYRTRFFLFLHTYDVHSEWKRQPYECPDGFDDLYTGDYSGGFDGCLGERCASELLLWLNERRRQDPGFDYHSYLGPPEIDFIEARYDGCINYIDRAIGEFADHLRALGIYDRTLLIVTSDHGEEFLDHGLMLHQNAGFEEMVRVPLVVKFPRSVFAGRRVGGMVATIDLMPSILDVLELEVNADAEGASFLPLVSEGRPIRRAVHMYDSLRTKEWKSLSHRGQRYLFHLAEDPGEKRNLIADRPEIAGALHMDSRRQVLEDKRRFQEFVARAGGEAGPPGLTEQDRDRLRALGYIVR